MLQVDNCRSHEIAESAVPLAAKPAPTICLAVSNDPVTFRPIAPARQSGRDIGIGRCGFGDETDQTATNSTDAAVFTRLPSQPVSR